jgi:REP element-mobilizing transposase RayT
MPIPDQYKAPFCFKRHYHILFRSIDGIPLFKTAKERIFFLEKWKRFTAPIADTWAYSLLDNHSHFIVKIKQQEDVIRNVGLLTDEQKTKAIKQFTATPTDGLFEQVAERQINSFLVSYANTYNNYTARKGGLFQQPFRRLFITDNAHLQQAIIYTHANAQKHGLVKNFADHPHHSYHEIIAGISEFVDCSSVIEFFDGKQKFIELHKEQADYFYTSSWE